MIIGLKSPGPECAHRSALAHRDWLSSSHRRGAWRSPPVAALPYSAFGLHRNLRCRCDLAPTRQSIGNSFHAGAGWGIFFAFCLTPSQRTRPFGLDHLTTRRELWSGRNGCSFDKFILRARGTDFSSESYVGVAKGHMLKPRPLSTGLRDLYRINIGSGPGTGFAGGYHSAATQKSRESAGDAVFGRRSVDRTEGSKKLNSG